MIARDKGRRVPALVFVAAILLLAVVIGIVVGALFARHQILSTPHLIPPVPGEFSLPAPRPMGEPSTPIPIPRTRAPVAIGFLDEQRDVAVPRETIKVKVGDCVVARLQPKHGSPYQRLVGGEHWNYAGDPSLEVRPGDAPGFCLSWRKPSKKTGFEIDGTAVVANSAGEQALGEGSAHVIVTGTPKPDRGATSKIIKHGRAKPEAQATPDDQ